MIYLFIAMVLLLIAFTIILYTIYRIAFCSGNMKLPDLGDVLSKDQISEFKEKIDKNIDIFRSIPFEEVEIRSFDKTKLAGRFYKVEKSKKVMMLFHGYKSHIDVDGSRAVAICLERGFNVLAVHQRGHDKSEGKVITFGIFERLDLKEWVGYIKERLGEDCSILLMGLSMGAATVMMSSNFNIPQIKGIYADCGYSSPKEILKIGIQKMKLSPKLCYPFLLLSAKLFAKFDPEEITALEALAQSTVPITLIHGEGDNFVPCSMSERCFEKSSAKLKKLIKIPQAGHGLCYYVDTEVYEAALNEMLSIVETN